MSRKTQAPERRLSNAEPAGTRRRVALLGAGYIADWHALALQTVEGVELAAVCDRYVAKAEALARKFGIPQVYGSLEEMLAAEHASPATLDAVHILTQPDRHFDAARTVLEAGVSVFLEKPMCDRAEDCEVLLRLAEERGLRVGVGHNFLFAEVYERLRSDVKSGVLGLLDDVVVTWHKPLPQAVHGPFDTWMLREPKNILFEVGSHSVAHMLDLVGEPEALEVRASNGTELPMGVSFYRRWQVSGLKGRTAVELRFSFVPGFAEYTIHVRGSLAAATVDFERNTYTLDEHRPSDPDFETHGIVTARAASLNSQSRETLTAYLKSKLKLEKRGNPYGASIARTMDAFYGAAREQRVDGRFGARVVAVCARMAELAAFEENPAGAKAQPDSAQLSARLKSCPDTKPSAAQTSPEEDAVPRILVLGGTGFIGKELLRHLIGAGYTVRALVRSAAGIPRELRACVNLECVVGDLGSNDDLMRAMAGVETVFHLARANVKSWADYRQFEIEATRRVGQCALAAQVKRLIYTGTIDSYYAGEGAGTITEATPLDAKIARRNLYARAKAASEEILFADAARAGIAAGDCAAGGGDWARGQPVPLGRGHVVERCGVPDVGRRQQQAGAGAGGRCGRRADRGDGDAWNRRTIVQSGGSAAADGHGISGCAGCGWRDQDSAARNADCAVLF